MTTTRRHGLEAALAACALAIGLQPASSFAQQDCPTRPISITAGYGAGDNMDIMIRMLASKA